MILQVHVDTSNNFHSYYEVRNIESAIDEPSLIDGFSIISLLFILLLYFLPTIIGLGRKHKRVISIFFMNLLFGWTLIGFILILIWSLSSEKEPYTINIINEVSGNRNEEKIRQLKQLRDSNVINEEVYLKRLNEIL